MILPEEGEDSLLRLAGEGQDLDARPLAGLPGQQVGPFLVEVGQGQLATASPVARRPWVRLISTVVF